MGRDYLWAFAGLAGVTAFGSGVTAVVALAQGGGARSYVGVLFAVLGVGLAVAAWWAARRARRL